MDTRDVFPTFDSRWRQTVYRVISSLKACLVAPAPLPIACRCWVELTAVTWNND